jgi:membrane associated rhomboid family serine protease
MFIPIKDYNPTKKTAYLTVTLIAINCMVFLYQYVLSSKPLKYHIMKSALIPWEITHFQRIKEPIGYNMIETRGFYTRENIYREASPILSLFYSLFMHGSLWHLLGNMLFLWIFGNNIEDYLGRFKFLIFYFLAGLCASFIHVIFNFNSVVPVIGASGAVSGIMGAYLILYPNARVRTLVFIFFFITFMDVPAFVFLIVWFIFQFFYAGAGSGIAWLAHVGGFIAGILLIKGMKNKPVIEIIQ